MRPRATFYRWYDRYREGGIAALADHRSRLESYPGRCARSDQSGQVPREGHATCARGSVPSSDPGKDRALAPDPQEPHSARQLLPAR
ncbi:helix-turn-helix domain-containing protein [Bradyrhizobium sp. DASA03120]|uniref:helix-turn-helix domain-containing protein n=1 Tax=Bradyrhizobium sp. SMVTL-02 TaxID=3395917 RepID=UPI003F6E7512